MLQRYEIFIKPQLIFIFALIKTVAKVNYLFKFKAREKFDPAVTSW